MSEDRRQGAALAAEPDTGPSARSSADPAARSSSDPAAGLTADRAPEAGSYYTRQIAFAGIGRVGQDKLAASAVALVGCGGTGSVVAEQLTRAGIERLKLIDRDYVEWDNLQRQVLFDEADAREALPKAVAGARRLGQINSRVQVEPCVADVNADNVAPLIADVDVVVDGTDNFETRFLLNDACVKAGKPWVYVAAVGSHGLTMTIVPQRTPCLRCLLPDVPAAGSLPTCASAGVVNAITGLVASIATAETLKLLVGSGSPNPGLISVDLWQPGFRVLNVRRQADCPACVGGEYRFLDVAEGSVAAALCGRDAVQLRFRRPQAIDVPELARRLQDLGAVDHNDHLLRFRTAGREMVLFADGRAIVKGTVDPAEARRFYAEFVGL